MTHRTLIVSALCLLLLPAFARAQRDLLTFDPHAIASVEMDGGLTLRDVPIPGYGEVTLELERFSVVTSRTEFVVGHRDIGDAPLEFDPDSVTLLRGAIEGVDHSHAYLSMHEGRLNGRIELGPGRERFVVTSRAGGGRDMGAGEALVLPDNAAGGSIPGCGVDTSGLWADWSDAGNSSRSDDFRPGLLQVEVAVETDYELYEQFFDLDAEMAYVIQLYGAVSDIFIRDVGVSIVLSYVRLWDDPDDLFNEEDPLGIFRDYWNDNMGHVHRDIAQFLSGRVNFWYGGIAWLSAVCTDHGYSISGYTLGYFADPDAPSVYNRDIIIVAHEIGHNLGTGHTQDYEIDRCHEPEVPGQRGPIMSYCGQTHTGGDANHDLRFHTITSGEMRNLLVQVGCVADDCNLNGVPDEDDISAGTSSDANGNGVPDECEDCNGNGVLDDADIASGTSQDIDGNGRPDECEPDCNGNGLPDAYDIETEISTDDYGDGVPDECETDCNGDGISDFTEINMDMSLDLDRDARLDACEDCDGDGVTDLAQLNGDNDVWVADQHLRRLRRFLSQTGTIVTDSDAASIREPTDVLALPGGRVLVSTNVGDRVIEFENDGTLVGDLIPNGTGGLTDPGAMLISPSGELLIASTGTNSVKAFNASTGAYIGDLVAPDSNGLVGPFGLAVSAEGTLLVTSADNRVLEFEMGTGAYVRDMVTAGDNGGLDDARGLLVLPNTNLLVASRETNQVLEFDGATGAFIRQFNRGGTADRMTLDQPWCIRLGPDGDVFVSRAHDHGRDAGRRLSRGGAPLHLTNARIYQFDVTSGKLVRAYVQSLDSGLEHPTGFDFVKTGGDCNLNLVPDSCDIASGASEDVNGNGVPDECETRCVGDHDGNGSVDTLDFIAFLDDWANGRPAADINGDLVINTMDFIAFLDAWAAGC